MALVYATPHPKMQCLSFSIRMEQRWGRLTMYHVHKSSDRKHCFASYGISWKLSVVPLQHDGTTEIFKAVNMSLPKHRQ